MADLELYTRPTDVATQPLACTYIQLPTIIVRQLQAYFAQTEDRWLLGASHFTFVDSERPSGGDGVLTGTPIEIFRADNYRGDVHTKLPKLIVRRNAVGARIDGIGRGLRMSAGTGPGGSKQVAIQYFGSVIIYALSAVPGEADLLAAETEQLLQHFGNYLRCQLKLQKAAISQIGEPGQLEEFPSFFAVPVVLDYIYEDNVTLGSGNFPVRRFQIEIE